MKVFDGVPLVSIVAMFALPAIIMRGGGVYSSHEDIAEEAFEIAEAFMKVHKEHCKPLTTRYAKKK